LRLREVSKMPLAAHPEKKEATYLGEEGIREIFRRKKRYDQRKLVRQGGGILTNTKEGRNGRVNLRGNGRKIFLKSFSLGKKGEVYAGGREETHRREKNN